MHLLSPSQCRAARALLDWNQPDLAAKCGIHVQTISGFEQGLTTPSQKTLQTIASVFEEGGIEFFDGDGIRRRVSEITQLSGEEGFSKFLDDVYNTCMEHGTKDKKAEVFLSNVMHRNWIKWMGEDRWQNHVRRMTEGKDVMHVRILVREGDEEFPAKDYAQYKWFPKPLFNDKSFYSYHDRLAFLNFQNGNVDILIMRQKEFAAGYRNLFRAVWDYVAKNPAPGK